MKTHNQALARAMEFTAHDLKLNQQGELSLQQRHKLAVMRDLFISDLDKASPIHIPSIIQLLCFGLFAGVLQLAGVLHHLQRGLDTWYLPVVIGTSLVLLGWLLWTQFRYRAMRTLLPELLDGMIQSPALYSVRGQAQLSLEELPTQTNYWLWIDSLRFPLTTRAIEVFQEGWTYRVFYIYFADAVVLMSAECLDDTNR